MKKTKTIARLSVALLWLALLPLGRPWRITGLLPFFLMLTFVLVELLSDLRRLWIGRQ